ncbi:MAG: DUF1700 domain-containing protein [Acholeplasmataceae bacterium]
MTKDQFIDALRQGLKKHHVTDIDDIIEDYEDYYREQQALGKSEQEIAHRLGDIKRIIADYGTTKTHQKRWFDIVAISFLALPLLIILYGLLITFIASSVTTWAIAIYYLFNVSTFEFMPSIPTGIHLGYVVWMLATSVFFLSLSIRFVATLKSMTQQYMVKQTIRIGDYHIKPIFQKLFIYSMIISLVVLVIVFILSVIHAQSFEFWHAWGWFQD